jgi:catechol 2,3-dioxygenase-like lactoylglutathione lyase family enzyme
MTIALDHTVVPVADKERAARWFAHVFGLAYAGLAGPFASVPVNTSLTLDFDDRRQAVEGHHYAFSMTRAEFEAVLERVTSERIPFGSDPRSATDGAIAHWGGVDRAYFADPDGHLYEVITQH